MRRALLTLLLLPALLGAGRATPAPPSQQSGPGPAAPQLRTAAGHRMQYLVSRPHGWKAGQRWPVVVVIDAAAREFRGNLDAFVRGRGARPFVLVAPFVVTGGGANYKASGAYPYTADDFAAIDAQGPYAFDESGLRAVIDDVVVRDGGEPRPYLTGWEAGGHTVWAVTFRHPEWWSAVVPVSTNYQGRWLDEGAFSKDPARARVPIHVLFMSEPAGGAPAAPAAFRAQTDAALAAARAHGFTHVDLMELKGKPHGPLAADVLDWITGAMHRRTGNRAAPTE